MTSKEPNQEDIDRQTKILVDQADRLIAILALDVSTAEKAPKGSPAFRRSSDAYHRLTLAQNKSDSVAWERTRVDGRDGDELMRLLWDVREKLRRQDQADV
jgi:hypothetical protein